MRIDDLIDTWPIETNYDGQIECWYQTDGPTSWCAGTIETWMPHGSYSVQKLRQQLHEHILSVHPEVLNG
jgi:hypothetical protein